VIYDLLLVQSRFAEIPDLNSPKFFVIAQYFIKRFSWRASDETWYCWVLVTWVFSYLQPGIATHHVLLAANSSQCSDQASAV